MTHVFLLDSALFAVVGVRDARPAADGAPALVGAVVTLVTDADERAWSHVRVTYDTLPVAFLAQSPDG